MYADNFIANVTVGQERRNDGVRITKSRRTLCDIPKESHLPLEESGDTDRIQLEKR